MSALAAWAVAMAGLATAAAAGPGQKVETPEGWYRVEPGFGESADSEVAIIVKEAQASPAPDAQPEEPQPPTGDIEMAEPQARGDDLLALLQPDCEDVRGRYLARLLVLHGVQPFWTDPKELAVWTRVLPPFAAAPYQPAGALGDPALAALFGLPPVPPGALSFDFTLQNLARDLLYCQQTGEQGARTPPPAPAPAPATPQPYQPLPHQPQQFQPQPHQPQQYQ